MRLGQQGHPLVLSSHEESSGDPVPFEDPADHLDIDSERRLAAHADKQDVRERLK